MGTAGRSLPCVSAMEFRVLGPIEVVADVERLDLGGPKQRTLLVLLVQMALSSHSLAEASTSLPGFGSDSFRRELPWL